MIFTNMFYKNHRSPLSKLRQHQGLPTTASPDWSGDEYADLVSRDKGKMKDAIKRYLSTKVRNDWSFTWPPPADILESNSPPAKAATAEPVQESLDSSETAPVQDEPNEDAGYQVDEDSESEEDGRLNAMGEEGDDDTHSIYSVVSLDPAHHKLREDWDSDFPADDPMPYGHSRSTSGGLPDLSLSKDEQRAVKRREMRQEMEWNEGLACFEARRNAWTQAKVVRVRPKPETPPASASPRSRRFFFRRSISSTASSQGARSRSGSTGTGLHSETSPTREADKESSKHDKASTSSASAGSAVSSYPVETIIPTAPPLLPPNNPLRASITSGNYLQLYDKLIVNNLQPACPVNLSDMIGACVAGWKRDGEWPVRPAAPVSSSFAAHGAARKKRASIVGGTDNPSSAGRRMSLTGLLTSRDRDDDLRSGGKGMRHSIQKVFGMGSPPISSHRLDPPAATERAVPC